MVPIRYKLVDGTSHNQSSLPLAEPESVGPDRQQIFGWFGKSLSAEFFESLKRDFGIVENSCIYTLTVTAWLMIFQRLSPGGTLATAVNELIHGNGRLLLEN